MRRIVYMSVAETPYNKSVTYFRIKQRIEEKIQGSGLAYSIFRGAAFMDDWFALMGSSIPLRGSKAHTLRRPFWFAKGFLKMVGTSIEKRGIALVSGDGKTRHAFVALDDVAAILAAAAAAPEDGSNLVENLGGPQALSRQRRRRDLLEGAGPPVEDDAHAGEGLSRARGRSRAVLAPGGQPHGHDLGGLPGADRVRRQARSPSASA